MMLLYYCYPKGLCRSVALWQLRTLGGLSNVTIFKIIIFGGLEIGYNYLNPQIYSLHLFNLGFYYLDNFLKKIINQPFLSFLISISQFIINSFKYILLTVNYWYHYR